MFVKKYEFRYGDLDKDGKLVAVDLQSKEPVDISAVIAAILVKHPTNKLILQ